MIQERTIDNLKLDGGWLSLDFINTVHDRTVPDPHEYLASYGELLLWLRKTQALSSEDIDQLEALYKEHPQSGAQTLGDILRAREILYRLFSAVARDQVPKASEVEGFNKLASAILSKIRIAFTSVNHTVERWDPTVDLEKPLYPLIKSAYDLLTSDKLNRIKECGACGWLFLDKSKNNSRRWCDMQTCGSSVKARRYYRKKKQQVE